MLLIYLFLALLALNAAFDATIGFARKPTFLRWFGNLSDFTLPVLFIIGGFYIILPEKIPLLAKILLLVPTSGLGLFVTVGMLMVAWKDYKNSSRK
jgi:hypothetical protein